MYIIKLYNSLQLKMSDPAFLCLFSIYYLANQFSFAATHDVADYSHSSQLESTKKTSRSASTEKIETESLSNTYS